MKKSFIEPDGNRLEILDVEKFHLSSGEQCLLVGNSGCGKTTLLHVIAGISLPDSGEVRVDNLNIAALAEAGRDRFRADKIGYVFQTFNLLTGFSALENIQLSMAFSSGRPDEGRARELLDRVGLGHRTSHRPSQLSVGERQRVAVARALANRPKLLLADEPTANVDHKNQQHLVDLIRETCREQEVSLLMVTHSPEIAEQFDRVEQLEKFNAAAG
ncbi:MAG: ABC transporter ATP-binding protein [Planctomycetales bacterium]